MRLTNINTENRRNAKILTLTTWLIGSTILTYNSCMMLGMWGASHSSHSGHTENKDIMVEGENSAVRAKLIIPPLAMGKDAAIEVIVEDRAASPISDATVKILINNQGSGESDEMTASETKKKGTYRLKHQFKEHGNIMVTAKITYSQMSDSLSITTTVEVIHEEKNHDGQSRTVMMVLGATAMAAMMAFMIARNF